MLNTKNVVPIVNITKSKGNTGCSFFQCAALWATCSDRKERGAARATLLHRCSAAAARRLAAFAVLLRRLSLCVTIVLTQDKQKRQSL